LPKELNILAFGRKPFTEAAFRNFTKEHILKKSKNKNTKNLNEFLKHIRYIRGNPENVKDIENLQKELEVIDNKSSKVTNKMFHLAVPPGIYGNVLKNLSTTGLVTKTKNKRNKSTWSRILIEKPLGENINDARTLLKLCNKLFNEKQIFHIDHYLAKDGLKDLCEFRFSNKSIESIWNNKNIWKIRILFQQKNTPEDMLANRGSSYDQSGALKDVGQNHMLQMLAVATMPKTKSVSAENIQRARNKILSQTSLRKDLPVVRGQYEEYKNEPGVKKDSTTETFFRLNLSVNTKRWKGVVFEMESGKALSEEDVSIEVFLKNKQVCLKFILSSEENKADNAYEKVLYDAIAGDQTIFVSSKEILAQWQITDSVIKTWQKIPLVIYKKGAIAKNI